MPLSTSTDAVVLVSPAAYIRILRTPRLRLSLLPEGLLPSPYAVLDYDATLILQDAGGVRATFTRAQRVCFQQDGVRAILDHAWGDGVLLTDYRHSAGSLVGSIRDGDRRHLIIALPRPMRRGEQLDFQVRRTAMTAFSGEAEWLQTVVDHPVQRLRRRVLFPVERPCRRAVLLAGGKERLLPVRQRRDGRTVVSVTITQPWAHRSYTVLWWW